MPVMNNKEYLNKQLKLATLNRLLNNSNSDQGSARLKNLREDAIQDMYRFQRLHSDKVNADLGERSPKLSTIKAVKDILDQRINATPEGGMFDNIRLKLMKQNRDQQQSLYEQHRKELADPVYLKDINERYNSAKGRHDYNVNMYGNISPAAGFETWL